MKKLFTLFIVVLFTQILPTQYIDAQTTNNASVKLIRALETGNADALAALFNDNVELVLPKTENFFTKQQAKSILTDFFKKNPVIDFNVLHKGNKENAYFIIGTIVSSRGSFRVSVFSRKSGAQIFVYQLRIEDPNE